MAKRKYDPEFVRAEMATWGREPDFITLSEEIQIKARERLEALKMYAEGVNVSKIEMKTNVSRVIVLRMFEKGMCLDDDGQPYGYKVLFLYNRTETGNNSKIQALFNKYEGLENQILSFHFSLHSGRAMKRPDKRTTHRYFITMLQNRGHKDGEYPFNLSDDGYRAFSIWLDKKEEEKRIYMKRQIKESRIQDRKTGTENRMLNPSRPFQMVEIDGHRLDLIYVVNVYDKEGKEHVIPVERPWLLAAIDIATRAILSYRLVFDKEYDSIDVMKLIEGITIPYSGKSGIRNDRLPSQVFDEVKYALPDLILLDNALAHYARDVLDKTAQYGYQFAYGPVADPTKRPHIERFFGTFEQKWGHRLPSTTGSNVNDPVRVKAEEDAIRFRFTRDHVTVLVSMAIAEYNNSVHSSLDGLTPIGMMRKLLSLGLYPNRLKPSLRNDFKLYCKREATFRGNKKTGRHVYVQINNFVYTSDIVKSNYNLVGEKVTLLIDPDNIKVIHAYSSRDVYFGPLFIKGSKNSLSGSLTMRDGKKAQKYLKEKGLEKTRGLDDVEMYTLGLEKKPLTKTNIKNLENISVTKPTEKTKPREIPEKTDTGNTPFNVRDTERKNVFLEDMPEEERRKMLRAKYENLK